MTRKAIFDVVKANIEKIVEGAEGKPIDESTSMRDLGADSLEVVEVISRSMKDLNVRVPRSELAAATSLKGLVDLFERAAPAREAGQDATAD